ncbi:LysR family transcriptional regulator [Guptibacillus algicola]|uniref:LysR family transcriptional regulator n=1 Tax=Guptibacillus algicola TaxID=225844 RepID=UPI001CD51F32|nr:LysR family transcriptional regulator [Alkalihalobacillus algicola]MCA0988349.1 LysR family transcriptional regulator [Alkalihalobacillus algicola]
MEIRHLEYFTEVAKQLSFTKAASTLHVSQPSISKSIKQIENELGVPLFYRSKQLELTDAGKAVLVNAKKVLQSFDNMTAELSDITAIKKGEIKIGIPPIIGAAFFSKLISQFKELYPSVTILLTEVGSKRIKQGVEDGSLDVGMVCNLPVRKTNFETLPVIKDPLMLIVHVDHPISKFSNVTINELQNEPFIMYREDFTLHDRIIEACDKHGFYPTIVCHSSQKDFMIEMVEAKLGIALLPDKIAMSIQNPSIKALHITNSEVSLELGLIWKKDKYLSFAVREFIKLAKPEAIE